MFWSENKKEGGSNGCFLLRSLAEMASRLAERAAGRGGCAAGIDADHTALVRVEVALPGDAHSKRRGSVTVTCCTPTTGPRDRVPGLGTASQDRINQVRSGGSGSGARHWSKAGQSSGELPPGGRVGDRSRVQRAQCSHGGRFIGRHLGTHQVWNCNRGDDQNNRDT